MTSEKSKRIFPVWLTISIGFNIFFIALILGGMSVAYHVWGGTKNGSHLGISSHRFDMGLHRLAWHGSDIPESVREKLRDKFQSSREEIRLIMRTDRRTRLELWQQVIESDLDSNTVQNVFKAQNETMSRISTLAQASTVEFIDSLTPEERAAVAEAMNKMSKKRQEHRRRWHQENSEKP